jgi:hypothetical protein
VERFHNEAQASNHEDPIYLEPISNFYGIYLDVIDPSEPILDDGTDLEVIPPDENMYNYILD